MNHRAETRDGATYPGFLVVGLGASAGGVEALRDFFSAVPGDSGMAYVVILHLSPEHDSQLATVLQAVTPLPVTQVTERRRVAPNHVYVVPPSQHLTMVDGEVIVSPNTSLAERRAPVDIFFRTLAETHDSRAVCVVLSGTGADGSMGLKRVKERGGAVFVQNPREAAFDEMPRSAIATNLVDDVLPVAAIPARIAAYGSSLGTIAIPVEAEERPEEQQQALREVLTHLRMRTGHDFSNYKRPTLLRRIERRINVRELPDLPAYAALLRENPDEVHALLKDLLISVTNFFRDKEAFAVLERELLPRIFQGRRSDTQVRIWVAGCATGEEAYSIAMLCAERVLDVLDAPSLQIFATDIDEAAIAHARQGLYSASDTADVSPERLRRFFTTEDQRYRIRREIREMVLFATHNLLRDPPFSHLDLVSCRNMLIYLNRAAQERVMETLHFALNPGGYLFLGTSESVDGANDLYAAVNREQHIYQSRPTSTRSFLVPELVPTLPADPPRLALPAAEPSERAPERIGFRELHHRLLEQYAPPSVVVNSDYAIVHLSGGAGRYLEMPSGPLATNLLDLIRPELRVDLRNALYQAVQQHANVDAGNLPIAVDGRSETVTIRIRPVLRHDDPARGFLLVLFEQGAERPSDADMAARPDAAATRQLEAEVERLHLQLHTSSEQYEFQAEELKATNEELQALNEELRSSTEELETSKEEQQSINEELRTVNQELKVKVEEATQTSANLQNLVDATDIATIFLDHGLRIRLFTPAARALFNLIPADYDRPLADITHRLVGGDVLADAEMVLDTPRTIEREVLATTNQVFVLRVLPYRAAEDRIGGVVLMFIDITARKRAEEALRESEERFRLFVTAASEIVYRMSADWSQMLLLEGKHFLADTRNPSLTWLDDYIPGSDKASVRASIAQAVGSKTMFELEHRVIRTDGTLGWVFSRAIPLLDERGDIVEWFGAASDITTRKKMEEALRGSEANQAFMLALSDALRPLADPAELQREAMRLLGKHLNADRAYYAEIDPDEAYAVVTTDYTDGAPSLGGRHRADDFGPKFIAELRAGNTVVIDDIARHAELTKAQRASYAALSIGALVVVPLVKGGRWIAVLGVNTSGARDWTAEEVALVEDTAQRTWAAVERAHAEAAVRKSEERFRLLIEGARDYAMFLIDPENGITFWSAGAERVFGWREAEVLGRSGGIIFTPEDRRRGEVEREIQTAVTQGRAEDRRWHVRKDGSRLFVDGVLIRLDDQGGHLRGFVKIGRDATEQHEAEQALQRAHQDLESRVRERTSELASANDLLQQEIVERRRLAAQRAVLVERILTEQENERQRIARELHDSLGQFLSALNLRLSMARSLEGLPSKVSEELAQLLALSSQIDREVDRLTMELRPPALEDFGLAEALRSYAEEWTATSGIPVDVLAVGLDDTRLRSAIETTVYRIAQEALTNVLKHAQASAVSVLVERRPGVLRVIIEDDGVGFDASAGIAPGAGGRQVGLIGMSERATLVGGKLTIESTPGSGTTLYLHIPIGEHTPESRSHTKFG